MTDVTGSLKGRRLLVVEDDYFIVEDLLRALERAGAEVVGPAARLDQALALAEKSAQLDGAVLDINVQGELIYPLAEKLMERGIPFVFLTGYDQNVIPDRFRVVTRLEKPVEMRALLSALFS